MTSDEKVKWMRDKVYEQEALMGLGVAVITLLPVEQEVIDPSADIFAFLGGGKVDPTPPRTVVVMTTEEQQAILRRLEKEGLIQIQDMTGLEAFIAVNPKPPAPLKLKTMEHIARTLADKFTGAELVNVLLDYGIARADIPYPNTKWRTLQEMFEFLGTSPNPETREKFGGAITAFLHPLNFGADEAASHALIEDFNKYLKYDGYEITAAADGDGYQLVPTKDKVKVAPPPKPLTEAEERLDRVRRNTPHVSTPPPSPACPPTKEEIEQEYSERVEYETGILRQPKVAEHLAVVREAYKTLSAIVSSFCADPTSPSRKLNTAYTELSKTVVKELRDFCGDFSEFEAFSLDKYKKNNFGIPFTGLYAAELEFKEKGKKLHWDEIRPEMNAVLGEIEELCDTANSPDVIANPEVQKVISDAMVLLSEIAAARKSDAPLEKTMKMEITGMPELQVRNVEEAAIQKGKKRVHLPKFTATEWSSVNIRFFDERNVFITAGKKQVQSDYEALGFADEKRDKPNTAWAFLLTLARNNGETNELPTPIPDTVKQQKRTLADGLKTIFKNDTDPFYDPSDTHTYKLKIALIPPPIDGVQQDELGVEEYLKETMTEK